MNEKVIKKVNGIHQEINQLTNKLIKPVNTS